MPYKTIGEVANKQISLNPANDLFKNMEYATIAEIREETIWPPEWHSAIGLLPYIKRLKGDLVGLEIGTGKGESAYLFLEECPNIKKLYTVDPYLEYNNWKETVTQERQNKYKEVAKKNLSVFGDRVEMVEFLSLIEKFDFIFLDGSDNYDQVYQDFEMFYPLLKPKGIWAGHNYQLEEVRSAMMAWRNKNSVRVPLNRVTNFSYFWYKA